MLKCCCCDEKEEDYNTYKYIQNQILKIPMCNTSYFILIIYVFKKNKFYSIFSTGYLLINITKKLKNNKLYENFELYRIVCSTIDKLIYTNDKKIQEILNVLNIDDIF